MFVMEGWGERGQQCHRLGSSLDVFAVCCSEADICPTPTEYRLSFQDGQYTFTFRHIINSRPSASCMTVSHKSIVKEYIFFPVFVPEKNGFYKNKMSMYKYDFYFSLTAELQHAYWSSSSRSRSVTVVTMIMMVLTVADVLCLPKNVKFYIFTTVDWTWSLNLNCANAKTGSKIYENMDDILIVLSVSQILGPTGSFLLRVNLQSNRQEFLGTTMHLHFSLSCQHRLLQHS